MSRKHKNLLVVLWPAVALILFFQSSPLTAQDDGEIEIVIRDSTFEFHGGVIKPHEPATIRLRNLDNIRHGFTSSLFQELNVEVLTEGGDIYGHGIKGVPISPGQEMEIRFTPTGQGRHSFRCDLHPKMKGELLVFSVGTV